ncbi:EamA family transporter [Marinoscillum sp. MHG1-6]|uniref:EamA family transporter n=1 Tax=Marinoscillum sp. MHG1-6 TaxID=2959627 RepID=UPI0021584D8B|nr:EamA family transporter [Marinoscillum sp. MHG1-6]
MDNNYSRQFLIILAFLSIYLIWGATYLAIAIAVKEIPPFVVASSRFIIAGVILVGYVLAKGEPMPSMRVLINNFIVGGIVLVGGQGLLMWSEQYIASGYASILIATLPFMFVLLDRKHWSYYFSNYMIILGLVVGFIGIILLFRDKLNEPLPTEDIRLQIIASIAVLMGGACWVSGTLYYRSHPSSGSMYSNLGWQLISAAFISFIVSLVLGEYGHFPVADISWQSWTSVLFLAFAGSIIAFVAYTWLLKELPSAIVGTYAYINPVIAVFMGWWIANEVISIDQIWGMLIILAGAFLVNMNRNHGKS